MECITQGVIESQNIEALENLLQDYSEFRKEVLQIREVFLRSKPCLGTKRFEVRLLCDLSKGEPSWMVKHVGDEIKSEDAGLGKEQTSILVRGVMESKTDKNVLSLFANLGYFVDYELLKDGFAYSFQRNVAEITVTLSSVNLRLSEFDENTPVKPGMHQVEVTAPATAESYDKVICSISSLCEDLAPLLHLSKPPDSTEVALNIAAAIAVLVNKLEETTL